ncbi:response regulator transcription factor [Paenibacillus sp. YN15]|uniref:response regulator n=1 Tax=Paenibacillus sp. YN15 TaxID=1742774 RepID=UPI000DCEEAB8|nr:response regulator transcription factor [Paenibacillus sp. YN15]RAU96370.1 DNA-binding response regulator [Paenibacillus sp. YN15]
MRVVVVDDDRLVTASLKTILEAEEDIAVAGVGNSGREAVELSRGLRPDILLMDIRMEGMTGIEAAELLLAEEPSRKILFLTTFSDDEYIVKALRIGAKGYILKQDFESIVPSLRTVYGGQRVFGDEIITRIPALLNKGVKADLARLGLNEKEWEIIVQVADGLSNKEIAKKLFLSEGTVRNYISIILEKLELRDRTQLAIFYFRNG